MFGAGLEFTYNAAADQFTLEGTVGVSVAGIASLSVDLGGVANGVTTEGLVITHGTLTTMNMTVTSSIGVSGLSSVPAWS